MFHRSLMLLLTMFLGSLADHEFFKGRRNNYNSNANNNEIYGGIENGPEHEMEKFRNRGYTQRMYELMIPYPKVNQKAQDTYEPGYSGPTKYGRWGPTIGALKKSVHDITNYDEFRRVGDFCDDNQSLIGRKNPLFHDMEDDEEPRRVRSYRPYNDARFANNVNSNANNNAIGMRFRRVSYWGPIQAQIQQDFVKNSRRYRGSSTNTNVNTNSVSGRRSNANSNVNSNEINYGERDHSRAHGKHDYNPSSLNNGQNEGGYGPLEYNKGREYPKRIPPWSGYVDQEEDDDEDVYNAPVHNDNVNLNSNMNIVGRRSNNMNANTNSNVFRRHRRSVKNSLSNEAVNEKDPMESSTKSMAEERENPHGAIYPGLA